MNTLEIIVCYHIVQFISVLAVGNKQLSANGENIRCDTHSHGSLHSCPSGNIHLSTHSLSNLCEIYIHLVKLL